MSAGRVRSHLMEHGVAYGTKSHPLAFTANEVAEAEHVPGHRLAKAVMLMAGDSLVMAVVPGDAMVDLTKAADALNVEEVRLAEEDEFSPSFPDCEIGAEPPFGSLYGVPMLVDSGLSASPITFNGGTHTDTITMELEDYLTLTHPKRADLSVGTG